MGRPHQLEMNIEFRKKVCSLKDTYLNREAAQTPLGQEVLHVPKALAKMVRLGKPWRKKDLLSWLPLHGSLEGRNQRAVYTAHLWHGSEQEWMSKSITKKTYQACSVAHIPLHQSHRLPLSPQALQYQE